MRALIIALCFLTVSCSTIRKIPIMVKPPSVYLEEPELPIKSLHSGSQPNEVMKAYVTSIVILKKDNKHLRTLLDVRNTQ
jgi:hypothetical protein